jgi:hypothetical protein
MLHHPCPEISPETLGKKMAELMKMVEMNSTNLARVRSAAITAVVLSGSTARSTQGNEAEVKPLVTLHGATFGVN